MTVVVGVAFGTWLGHVTGLLSTHTLRFLVCIFLYLLTFFVSSALQRGPIEQYLTCSWMRGTSNVHQSPENGGATTLCSSMAFQIFCLSVLSPAAEPNRRLGPCLPDETQGLTNPH